MVVYHLPQRFGEYCQQHRLRSLGKASHSSSSYNNVIDSCEPPPSSPLAHFYLSWSASARDLDGANGLSSARGEASMRRAVLGDGDDLSRSAARADVEGVYRLLVNDDLT